jgi:hypothetical protein
VSETYYGLTRDMWDELDPRGRWEEMKPRIKELAKKIDPGTFVSWFQCRSIVDPCDTGYQGEDNIGRVWWVRNPDDEGAPVTAWDLAVALPSGVVFSAEDAVERIEVPRPLLLPGVDLVPGHRGMGLYERASPGGEFRATSARGSGASAGGQANGAVLYQESGEAPDSAITQLLSYIGSLETDGRPVRGILIARDFPGG